MRAVGAVLDQASDGRDPQYGRIDLVDERIPQLAGQVLPADWGGVWRLAEK